MRRRKMWKIRPRPKKKWRNDANAFILSMSRFLRGHEWNGLAAQADELAERYRRLQS